MSLALGGGIRWEIETSRGIVRDSGFAKNGITEAALDSVLNTYFRNGSPAAAFFAGLIKGDTTFLGVAAADTMTDHAGWAEGTAYSEATRLQWSPAASTARLLTNGTRMLFTANAVQTVAGFFIATESTKGGTTGLLWATALFTQLKQLAVGERIKTYYELAAQGV